MLFQLAPWIKYSDEALAGLASLPKALPDMVVAVEFRNRSWFGPLAEETLTFLRDHRLTYVSIAAPRTRLTAPSVPALTTSTAVFRLHGRNFAGHLKQVQGKSPTVAEKYDYLYSERELEDVARAAGTLNGKADRVHVAMNNNRGDYPAMNGIALKQMLLENWRPPDRDALVAELNARRAKGRQAKRTRRAAWGCPRALDVPARAYARPRRADRKMCNLEDVRRSLLSSV